MPQCASIGDTEDLAHHQPDNARSAVAVAKQLVLGIELAEIQIHLHAIKQGQRVTFIDVIFVDQFCQPC